MKKLIIAITVAAMVAGVGAGTAGADFYNDPTNDNDDRFYLDLEDYEPGVTLDAVVVTIDVAGDDPREYRMLECHDSVAPCEFTLMNPRPEEK